MPRLSAVNAEGHSGPYAQMNGGLIDDEVEGWWLR